MSGVRRKRLLTTARRERMPRLWQRCASIAITTACALTVATAVAIAASTPKTRAAGGADIGAEAVFRAARSYTVRIRTRIDTPFAGDERGSFSGAGFLVDVDRRWIVTNAHVVGQSPSDIEVAFADEPFQPARKVYVDTFADVAVLTVASLPRGRTVPSLNCDDAVRIGEPVGVFGHPLSMHFTGTRGIVSNKTDQDGPDLLQIDATVDHGNSGGPVIALGDGRVVGIATSGVLREKSDRLNFATPMKDVCRILALLRDGFSPSPPRMEIALLKDEDGRHTMTVARSFDVRRWPLLPNDRIISVGKAGDETKTLTDLVSAMRGSSGVIPLTIERAGRTHRVDVTPALRPLVVGRRGILVDGALIAPIAFDDETHVREPFRLVVHSVEPGSAAEMLLEPGDVLQAVDGQSFRDTDSLSVYLRGRTAAPITVVLTRWSSSAQRLFDYNVRELPGSDVRLVEEQSSAVATTER